MMWDDDELYLTGRAKTIMKMFDMCKWIPEDDLVALLDHPGAQELVKSWVEESKIFSIPAECGALFPAFQFDAEMRPIRIIKEVLNEFGDDDPYAIAAWFLFKNSWINKLIDGKPKPVSPMTALEDTEAILNAARNEARGTYFA